MRIGLGLNLAFGRAPFGGAAGVLRNALFGVNLAGAEFAPWNGQTWPSTADATYLASVGVGFVRLPIAWESIQPTLGAALDPTYLAALKSTIATLKAKGISTIVDLHNFGHYITQAKWIASDGVVSGYAGNAGITATGVNVLGDATLTQSAFVDLWTRLVTALVGTSGLIGYGLMNEPSGVIGKNKILTPNYFGGNLTQWGKGGTETLAIRAKGSNSLGANYGPAWDFTTTNYGNVSQVVTVPAGQFTFSAYLGSSIAQPAYLQIDGTQVQADVTTVDGRFTQTATLTAGSHTFSIGTNGPGFGGSGTVRISNAQLEAGASATAYEPNTFISFAQAAINAIRAIDANTLIQIGGAGNANAVAWQVYNYELATLTGTGLVFDAHQYFDGPTGVGGGGQYSGDYSSYNGLTASSGVTEIQPFLDWISATGKTGFLGEFGVPNKTTDNNAAWLPLQLAVVNALNDAGVQGTQWFYGSNGLQPSNILNIAAASDVRLMEMLAVGPIVRDEQSINSIITDELTNNSKITDEQA